MNARESFSYRLQAAADLAQSLAQRLADLAPHGEPTPEGLSELRCIENGLDVYSRITMGALDKAATKVPA